jgi:Methyltransferase domain
MPLDLAEYRAGPLEQTRLTDLMAIMPAGRRTALDIGARDGYVSRLLVSRFAEVTALDLTKPELEFERIVAVQGDVTDLQFPDNCFDVIVCTEVLEHIPKPLLNQACKEIVRVARHEVVIGVPYRQDTRVGRTTCFTCRSSNPPWGHVNSFDQRSLAKLFHPLSAAAVSLVGPPARVTNRFSTLMMDLAGNPWGTYDQAEPCTHCGAPLIWTGRRSLGQRLCSAAGVAVSSIQNALREHSPMWIHMLFKKNSSQPGIVCAF